MGSGSGSGPTWISGILAGAQVGATVGQAYQSYETGVVTSNEDKQKARVASDQARQQQINMRQKLLAGLATQNAQAAIGGGAISKANTLRQITQNQNDLMVSKADAAAQVSLFDTAAGAARRAGDIGAATNIVQGIASIAAD